MARIRQIRIDGGRVLDMSGTHLEIDYSTAKIQAVHHKHMIVWKLDYKPKEKGSTAEGWNFRTQEGTNVLSFKPKPEEAIAQAMKLWPDDIVVYLIEP